MIIGIAGSLFWVMILYMAVRKKLGNKKGALCAFFLFLMYCVIYVLLYRDAWVNIFNLISVCLLFFLILWMILPDAIACFAQYKIPFVNRSNIFRGKKVLVIIPHQDDDVNLMGTVITEYTHYGSEVYLLFFSNDSLRIKEALLVAKQQGIPKRNIRFKSYSECGRQEQTCIEENIESFIEEVRPSVIFSVDKDAHPDHRLISDAFDAVFKRIRLDDDNITVFKGFAYSTAWTAEDDFYNDINIRSSLQKKEMADYGYIWDKRIRFPVSKGDLNRCMSGCRSYWNLYLYKSQNAVARAGRVINGDKVFWCISGRSFLENWIKIMDEKENFIYDYLLKEDKKDARFLIYDTRGKQPDMDYYRIIVLKQINCEIEERSSYLCLKFHPNNVFCHIRVEDQSEPQIYDEVIVRSMTVIDKMADSLASYVDRSIAHRIITMYYDFLYLLNT